MLLVHISQSAMQLANSHCVIDTVVSVVYNYY